MRSLYRDHNAVILNLKMAVESHIFNDFVFQRRFLVLDQDEKLASVQTLANARGKLYALKPLLLSVIDNLRQNVTDKKIYTDLFQNIKTVYTDYAAVASKFIGPSRLSSSADTTKQEAKKDKKVLKKRERTRTNSASPFILPITVEMSEFAIFLNSLYFSKVFSSPQDKVYDQFIQPLYELINKEIYLEMWIEQNFETNEEKKRLLDEKLFTIREKLMLSKPTIVDAIEYIRKGGTNKESVSKILQNVYANLSACEDVFVEIQKSDPIHE